MGEVRDEKANPYGAAVGRTQKTLRNNGHFDGVSKPLPNGPAASRVAQELLGQLGHPRASEAFVFRHPNPDARKSQVVFDGDTGAPGVALHPDRWDHGTLAHECAHHMDIHHSGMDPMASHSDEEKHGPRFVEHYQQALDAVHPDAGMMFGRIHRHVVKDRLREHERWQQGQATVPPKEAAMEPPLRLHDEQWVDDRQVQGRITAVHPDRGTVGHLDYRAHRGQLSVRRLAVTRGGRDTGEALLDRMVALHPKVRFPTGGRTAALRPFLGEADPWEKIRSSHAELHRGVSLKLDDEDHDYVHNQGIPAHKRAQHLLGIVSQGNQDQWRSRTHSGLGTHWSTDESSAHHFAHEGARAGYQKYDWEADGEAHGHNADGSERQRPETRVVMHAHMPERHGIASDESDHEAQAFGWDAPAHKGGDFYEREVPIKTGHPVHVKGISWGLSSDMNDDPAPHDAHDAMTRHDFADAVTHKASRRPFGRESARTEPSARLFGKTYGLDPRLWDGEHLRPEIRAWVLGTLEAFWRPVYGSSWHRWARVYFAGSEASTWTSETLAGNGDFDILLGLNGDEARASVPTFVEMTDDEIAQHLNSEFQLELIPRTTSVWFPVGTSALHSRSWENGSIPRTSTKSWSGSTSRTSGLPQPSVGTSVSRSQPSATTWSVQGSPETPYGPETGQNASQHAAPASTATSPSRRSGDMGQWSPSARDASPPTFGATTCYAATASRPSSSKPSSRRRAEDADSASGQTSSSSSTTITDAAQASGRAVSVFEASSAPGATRRLATSERSTSSPLPNTSTPASSSPTSPDGQELVGPFEATFFVNPRAWDITAIKPYAAYDVSNDSWVVKPPHLEHWSIEDFPQGHPLHQQCRAVEAEVRAVLKMPEPYCTQQADALWHYLHADRGRAFSDQGEGWFDSGNVIEKWLSQVGEPSLWDQLAALHFQAVDNPHLLDAPADWSNEPAQVS